MSRDRLHDYTDQQIETLRTEGRVANGEQGWYVPAGQSASSNPVLEDAKREAVARAAALGHQLGEWRASLPQSASKVLTECTLCNVQARIGRVDGPLPPEFRGPALVDRCEKAMKTTWHPGMKDVSLIGNRPQKREV